MAQYIYGKNVVKQRILNHKKIHQLLLSKTHPASEFIELAKEARIPIRYCDDKELSKYEGNHQGVIAIVPPFEYSSVEDIVEEARKRNEQPFILILDGIEDPHNLGSIIRTAETAGVHGIIIPKRRAAAVNSTVNKVSAGAVQYMKIARVNNINETIKYLKSNDIWICGTDMNTNKYYYEENYNIPIAFVIGSEGFGISRLVKENCDFLVKIPMNGKISSLNASVSAGIVMYEAVKQRKNK